MNHFNNTPPRSVEVELREQSARLKNLERLTANLQGLISAGRKEPDFDLFWRKVNTSEKFLTLPPEVFGNFPLTDWYFDFWKLVGESMRTTKFVDEEKNIAQQILSAAKNEQNPVRRQILALALLMFGEFEESQRLIDQKLWSPQLREDFATFMKWNSLVNNPLPPQARAKIERNDKILAFLQEKFSALIQKHAQAVVNEKTCPRVENYQIYFCWLQGEEHLPPLVRCCYNSLKRNAGRYKIVFIDEENFSRYVNIAPHLLDKFRAGKISRTHFSDILRINLLEQHGGLWLDSTILVTEPLENHKNLWQLPYFTQKYYHEVDYLKPYTKSIGWCVSYARWAGFAQSTTILHNPLFTFEKNFLEEYWRNFDELVDYVLIDFMMELAYKNIPFVRQEMDAVPINNLGINDLVYHLNDSYAAYPFDKILAGTFLHKLSWKIPLDTTRDDTNFREIQRRYAPETLTK